MSTRLWMLAAAITMSPLTARADSAPAASIKFRNSTGLTAPAGKRATTVQQAIDGLSIPVGKLIAGRARRASTWTGKLTDVAGGALRETEVTVTFTPTDDVSGEFSSSPLNLFSPSDSVLVPDNDPNFPSSYPGTYSGTYRVVDTVMFGVDVSGPAGPARSAGIVVTANGDRLVLTETQVRFPLVLVLSRE